MVSLLDRVAWRFIPGAPGILRTEESGLGAGPCGRIVRMSFTLAFHDSELRDVVVDSGTVRLRFSAASVIAADGERGWLPGVVLTLAQAVVDGDAAHAFGKLVEGRLRHDGAPVARPALPGTLAGDIDLALRLANGTALQLRGRSLSLALADDARLAPDLSC